MNTSSTTGTHSHNVFIKPVVSKDTMLRKSEEKHISLRKSYIEDSMALRRNIGEISEDYKISREQLVSPIGDQVFDHSNKTSILSYLASNDDRTVKFALYEIEILLNNASKKANLAQSSKTNDTPSDLAFKMYEDLDVINTLVTVLLTKEDIIIKFYCAQILVNLSFLSTDCDRFKPELIEAMIDLFKNMTNFDVKSHLIYFFTNLVDTNELLSDIFIDKEIIEVIYTTVRNIESLTQNQSVEIILRDFKEVSMYFICKLIMTKNPKVYRKHIMALIFSTLDPDNIIDSDKTRHYSLLSILYFFKNRNPTDFIKELRKINIVEIVIYNLQSEDSSILRVTLKILQELIYYDDVLIQLFLNKDLLTQMKSLLETENESILKEVLFCLVNISAGTVSQVEKIVEKNIPFKVMDLLSERLGAEQDTFYSKYIIDNCFNILSFCVIGGLIEVKTVLLDYKVDITDLFIAGLLFYKEIPKKDEIMKNILSAISNLILYQEEILLKEKCISKKCKNSPELTDFLDNIIYTSNNQVLYQAAQGLLNSIDDVTDLEVNEHIKQRKNSEDNINDEDEYMEEDHNPYEY